jgi:hypothetical protein
MADSSYLAAGSDDVAVVKRAPAPGRRPLPDAVAMIGLVAVPDAAPPYDEAFRGDPGGRPPGRTPQRDQEARPPGQAPRGDPGARPPGQTPRAAPGGRARRQALPAAGDDPGAGRTAAAMAALAAADRAFAPRPGQGEFAGHWPNQFAQALAETLAGSRPPSQLAPWTTQQTRRRISQLGPSMSTAHRPRVRRVIITSPTAGVLEMTVIVGLGPRVRAVAVRLERTPPTPPGDSSGGRAAGLQTAVPGPQAALGRDQSRRAAQAESPGWICTAIEAA